MASKFHCSDDTSLVSDIHTVRNGQDNIPSFDHTTGPHMNSKHDVSKRKSATRIQQPGIMKSGFEDTESEVSTTNQSSSLLDNVQQMFRHISFREGTHGEIPSPRTKSTAGSDEEDYDVSLLSFEGEITFFTEQTEEKKKTTVPVLPSVWQHKLCGVRADGCILLLVLTLAGAFSVILGCYLAQSREVAKSATVENKDISIARTFNDAGFRTRTPTIFTVPSLSPDTVPLPTAGPTVKQIRGSYAPTISPQTVSALATRRCLPDDKKITFPIGGGEHRKCSWLFLEADQELKQYLCEPGKAAHVFCQETCGNCDTLSSEKLWPTEDCGSDYVDTFNTMDGGILNCAWLAIYPKWARDEQCDGGAESIAFQLCRETCRNCGPNVDATPLTEITSMTLSNSTGPSDSSNTTFTQDLSATNHNHKTTNSTEESGDSNVEEGVGPAIPPTLNIIEPINNDTTTPTVGAMTLSVDKRGKGKKRYQDVVLPKDILIDNTLFVTPKQHG